MEISYVWMHESEVLNWMQFLRFLAKADSFALSQAMWFDHQVIGLKLTE